MMPRYDYDALRRAQRVDRFCDLLDEVERGGSDLLITKHDVPAAVVVEYEAYRTMREALRELDDQRDCRGIAN